MAVLINVEPQDDALVEAARQRPEAFGELYDRYVDAIYSYIRYRVPDEGDAEDLTAQTFHRALTSLPAYENRGLPFGAWLYRIAHNLVANWHRHDVRHPQTSLEGLDEEPEGLTVALPPSVHEVDTMFERQLLLAALGRLEEDRQALLIYKFSQGLSNAEIATILGRSEGAIKSLYHRTLLELRAQLDPGAALAAHSEASP